jgi:predicted nucleic acid-binding protein
VIVERGSELVAELWGTRQRVASSMLAYPEGRAALAAAHRGGRLSADGHSRAREEFEALQDEMLLIGIDRALTQHAGQLAEDHSLRGYDAVHLASALALGEDVTLVTWDRDLREAAARSAIGIAPRRSARGVGH